MELIKDLNVWRKVRRNLSEPTSVGFVPTMGALHEGHKSLLDRCRRESDISVLSIFVNPTQFNDPGDLQKYPIDLESDQEIALKAGVDFLLTPTFDQIYPDHYRYKVVESEMGRLLCGEHRPGHFDGVLTVVMRLFNLVRPQKAFFGEKDYQQLLLIQQMVEAFFMEIEIVACPSIREVDGLALSSRNRMLSAQNRQLAPKFSSILSSDRSCEAIRAELEKQGFCVDYVEEHFGRRLGAVKLGEVRLIDNVKI